MKIKMKMHELQDADVSFISLVDRSATRMPFRVLKQETEELDLSKVFKSEEAPQPEIVAVVVFDQEAELTETVRQSIANAGFATDKVTKSDDGETLIYAQSEVPAKDTKLIRLSDQMVLVVKGFTGIPEDGEFEELAASNGFLHGVNSSLDVLYNKIGICLRDAKDHKEASEAIKKLLTGFSIYMLHLVDALPPAAFQADEEVQKAVKKFAIKKAEEAVKKELPEESVEKCDDKKKMTPEEEAAEKAKAKKEDEVVAAPVVVTETPLVDPKVVVEEPVKKSDTETILEALKGVKEQVATQVAELATKIEGIVKKQDEQQKALDGVVQKAETLSATMATTVIAPATPPDKPSKETAAKADNDPRSGCFDTAFMPGRRR